MWQFNLRTALMVLAGVSALLAAVGPFIRANVFPIEIWIWLATALTGSLAGTVYGTVRNRPERNRWLRAFASGSLAGAMGFVAAFPAPRSLFNGYWWLLGLMLSTIPGCLAASICEAFRLAVARFASAAGKPAGGMFNRRPED